MGQGKYLLFHYVIAQGNGIKATAIKTDFTGRNGGRFYHYTIFLCYRYDWVKSAMPSRNFVKVVDRKSP